MPSLGADLVLGLALVAALSVYERGRARSGAGRRQRSCAWGATGVGLLAVGLPWAGRPGGGSVSVVTLQVCLVLYGVTPLAVLAAPFARRRRSFDPESAAGGEAAAGPHPVGRPDAGLAAPSARWLLPLVPYAAAVVVWRLPATVDALPRTHALVAAELVTAALGSLPLWRALLGPGAAGGTTPPQRLALAMLAAWATWIAAYIIGLSGSVVFPAYRGLHGSLGAVGDQELAVGIMFATSAAALLPVVFVNLTRWLGTDAARPELTLDDIRRPGAQSEALGTQGGAW